MKLTNYLFGSITVEMFIGAAIFAIVGVLITKTLDATTRNPKKPGSPVHWDWNYFWSDNFKRIVNSIISSILVVFCSLRFSKELFGTELSMIYALVIGLGLDAVKVWFRKLKQTKFENLKKEEDEKQSNG